MRETLYSSKSKTNDTHLTRVHIHTVDPTGLSTNRVMQGIWYVVKRDK